jgi:hypothetical protein
MGVYVLLCKSGLKEETCNVNILTLQSSHYFNYHSPCTIIRKHFTLSGIYKELFQGFWSVRVWCCVVWRLVPKRTYCCHSQGSMYQEEIEKLDRTVSSFRYMYSIHINRLWPYYFYYLFIFVYFRYCSKLQSKWIGSGRNQMAVGIIPNILYNRWDHLKRQMF